MVEKTKAINLLEELRYQVYRLVQEAGRREEFDHWYREAVDTIQDIFGPDSEEMREFQQIKFEIHPETV